MIRNGRALHKNHGKKVSVYDIDAKLIELAADHSSNALDVSSLYRKLHGPIGKYSTISQAESRALQRDLTALCCLPMFSEIFKALGIQETCIHGYPLRYGYYVNQFR